MIRLGIEKVRSSEFMQGSTSIFKGTMDIRLFFGGAPFQLTSHTKNPKDGAHYALSLVFMQQARFGFSFLFSFSFFFIQKMTPCVASLVNPLFCCCCCCRCCFVFVFVLFFILLEEDKFWQNKTSKTTMKKKKKEIQTFINIRAKFGRKRNFFETLSPKDPFLC